jgi:hypothetical protein
MKFGWLEVAALASASVASANVSDASRSNLKVDANSIRVAPGLFSPILPFTMDDRRGRLV